MTSFAQKPDTRYFELRMYYAHPGQLESLINRFQDHTTRIFEKHGIENIGYWVPVKNELNMLYYILAFPNKEARNKSWDAFHADPEWIRISKSTQTKLVDSIVSVTMNPSEILPMLNLKSAGKDRIFELRTYVCFPGRLPNLIARFRDHTHFLFEKHGIDNIAYFISEEKEGVQSRLIYLLGYPSKSAHEKSWAEFQADPEWIKVKADSEKDGKIVGPVESVFLRPLGFSKTR